MSCTLGAAIDGPGVGTCNGTSLGRQRRNRWIVPSSTGAPSPWELGAQVEWRRGGKGSVVASLVLMVALLCGAARAVWLIGTCFLHAAGLPRHHVESALFIVLGASAILSASRRDDPNQELSHRQLAIGMDHLGRSLGTGLCLLRAFRNGLDGAVRLSSPDDSTHPGTGTCQFDWVDGHFVPRH